MNSVTFTKDLVRVQDDLLRFAYKLTSDQEEAGQRKNLRDFVFKHII